MSCRRTICRAIVCLFLLGVLSGCSSKSSQGRNYDSVKLSELLPSQPKVLAKRVLRRDLEQAIENSLGRRGVRIVKIFHRNAIQGIPEHRVFDVTKDSPFYLLGVRSGDVLLGVNDRTIPQSKVMSRYPQAVLRDRESSITLNRGEHLFRLKISVSESS